MIDKRECDRIIRQPCGVERKRKWEPGVVCGVVEIFTNNTVTTRKSTALVAYPVHAILLTVSMTNR